MLRSIPSLASGVVLLSLILYVYAIVGVSLFRHADPAHWGTLGRAALTLFEALTPQYGGGQRREARLAGIRDCLADIERDVQASARR